MDAHLFRLACAAFLPLISGARIEKIQQPLPQLLTFGLYGKNQKFHFLFRYGKKNPFMFISMDKLGAHTAPDSCIMRFRRYFADKRIATVVPQYFSRKLWLMAATETDDHKLPWLCLDLIRGPSLHFLDTESVPAPEEPEWPEIAVLEEALRDWRKWPVLTPALRKTLLYLSPPDQAALLQDLRSGAGDLFTYGKEKIEQISAWPLPAQLRQDLQESVFENDWPVFEKAAQNLVLPGLYAAQSSNLLAPLQKREKQIKKILEKQAADEKRLKNMLAREEDALAIKAHIWKLPMEEHRESLVLPVGDGSREIILEKRFSVRENMERFFHSARRAKRGLLLLEERKQALLEELGSLSINQVDNTPGMGKQKVTEDIEEKKRVRLAIQKKLPKNVRLYASSDAYLILRGKDAKGNSALRRYASPFDLWAHVEQGVGAHVLIKRAHPSDNVPERTLEEAGSLAASKSWLAEAATAAVMFAEMRHVKPKKGAGAGQVTIDKLFLTRTVSVDPEIEEKLLRNLED